MSLMKSGKEWVPMMLLFVEWSSSAQSLMTLFIGSSSATLVCSHFLKNSLFSLMVTLVSSFLHLITHSLPFQCFVEVVIDIKRVKLQYTLSLLLEEKMGIAEMWGTKCTTTIHQ